MTQPTKPSATGAAKDRMSMLSSDCRAMSGMMLTTASRFEATMVQGLGENDGHRGVRGGPHGVPARAPVLHPPGGGGQQGHTQRAEEHRVEQGYLGRQNSPFRGEDRLISVEVEGAGDDCEQRQQDGHHPHRGALELDDLGGQQGREATAAHAAGRGGGTCGSAHGGYLSILLSRWVTTVNMRTVRMRNPAIHPAGTSM